MRKPVAGLQLATQPSLNPSLHMPWPTFKENTTTHQPLVPTKAKKGQEMNVIIANLLSYMEQNDHDIVAEAPKSVGGCWRL